MCEPTQLPEKPVKKTNKNEKLKKKINELVCEPTQLPAKQQLVTVADGRIFQCRIFHDIISAFAIQSKLNYIYDKLWASATKVFFLLVSPHSIE